MTQAIIQAVPPHTIPGSGKGGTGTSITAPPLTAALLRPAMMRGGPLHRANIAGGAR